MEVKSILLLFIFCAGCYSLSLINGTIPKEDQENFEITKETIEIVNKIENVIVNKNNKYQNRKARKRNQKRKLSKISNKNAIVKAIENSGMFEGDIMLNHKQALDIVNNLKNQAEKEGINIPDQVDKSITRMKRKIDGDIKYNWTFPIKYFVEKNVNSTVVDRALHLLELESCVRFNRTDKILNDTQGLRYYFGPGCFSYVGKMYKSKMQDVSLGEHCDTIGTVQHETLHALGFDHEQCRYDRDEHLDIFFNNVEKGSENNFIKLEKNKAITFGIPYDYGSVMQYTYTSFSQNDNVTMLPKKPFYNETLGLDEKASFLDIKLLNNFYCSDICLNKLKCENGGYQDPNDCSKCKCVEGFEGLLCDEMPKPTPICKYAHFEVLEKQQTLTLLGEKNCVYHFLAEEGTKIVLHVEKARFMPRTYPACSLKNSLEIKYLDDKTVTGAVICGGKVNLHVKSINHHLMLYYRSSEDDNGAVISFRSVKKSFLLKEKISKKKV